MNDPSIDRNFRNTNERRKDADLIEVTTESTYGVTRRPVASALVNPHERRSIVDQICIHGKTVQQVSQNTGLPRNVIETVLIQQLSNKGVAEYRRGYEDGRRQQLPLRPMFARRAS